MLVICCGMMRSGSTLQYQLAVAVLERTGKGSALGEIRHGDCRELEKANTKGEIQVLKVHKFSYLKGAKEAIEQGKATGLYVYRDIRNVTVSLIKMRKISFEKLIFQSKDIQQCLDDFYRWNSLEGLLVSKYETMIHDLTGEVLRIAAHLNINLSHEDAQAIAENHSLNKQKNRIIAWKEGSGKDSRTHEPKTLLHYNHINSGQSKQWANSLSPLQIGHLENMASDWLHQQGYFISQPPYVHWTSRLVFGRYELMRKIVRLKHHWQQRTLISTFTSKWR